MKPDLYYAECEVAVLAKATGGILSLDGDIVKLHYKRMLQIKDYGFYPEGWEYEIDESPLYNLDEYERYKPYKMYRVEAYYDDVKFNTPRDLKILEVYKTHIIKFNTDGRLAILERVIKWNAS